MPADFLLPAFALTLALNAILVAVAIRALRNSSGGAAVPTRAAERADPASAPHPLDGAAAAPSVARARAVPPTVEPGQPAPSVEIDRSRPGRASAPTGPGAARRSPTRTNRSGPDAERPRKPSTRRRRFSLPPLEDHDKVSRSIETFLAGSDASTPESPASSATPAVGSPSTVVTVAVVALVGRASSLATPDGPVWRPAAELRALLERTVRSTARGTDTVAVDRQGRVRVVLAGTGELAAHAYLRRIRAIVEPIADAADPPVRVVIATATDLDGAIDAARRRAERRLGGLLGAPDPASAAERADDPADHREPRASGD